MRKTKIVATIGPATASYERIKTLIETGVNVFRLNFSHGDHDTHRTSVETIRSASKALACEVAILQDISGPKVRIGKIEDTLELNRGDTLKLCKVEDPADPYSLSLTYPEIIDRVGVGEEVYFADGTVKTQVTEKSENCLILTLLNDGKLTSKKGVNFPHTKLGISAITQKDEIDLAFGVELGIDIVALSFVQNAHDVTKAKVILEDAGSDAMIISKIETTFAIENLDEILAHSDGVMVARGDLGAELGVERVPNLQKQIIQKANLAAKPVITATQMLLSMVNAPFPTRAEVSDVANAVFDGSDAVMLSDETTIGQFPIEAVQTLVNSILEAEKKYPYYKTYETDFCEVIPMSAASIARDKRADAIVTFTTSGFSARTIAKFRPKIDILAVTHSIQWLRKLQLVWGVQPVFIVKESESTSKLIYDFLKRYAQKETIRDDSLFIITMGYIVGQESTTNLIRVLDKYSIEKLERRFKQNC